MLETERTIIRPYGPDAAALLRPILSDPTTMKFWERPLTDEQIAGWAERSAQSFAATGLGRMLIADRASGAIIGDCGIVLAEINGRQEHDLGYIIHHPYWRQGYASECARACLEHGLQVLGLRRIVANMAHDHHGSRRVAEKLGMRREAEFRNPRNRNILTYLYALNVSDSA